MKKFSTVIYRKLHLFTAAAATLFFTGSVFGQSLTQTFTAGENTSDWGSTGWQTSGTFGTIGNGFLAPSLGGVNAGYGSNTNGQSAQRSFINNTAGINVSTMTYTVSMYFMIAPDAGNVPASGNFNILDGQYGDYTANLQLSYQNNGSGNSALSFAALSNNGRLNPLNVNIELANPYYLQFSVDPVNRTYSTTLSKVDTSGNILSTATLNDLVITGNAINNHQNGNLEFYLNTSAGNAQVWVDNIVIAVPEPADMVLMPAAAMFTLLLVKRNRSRLI